MNNRYKEKKVGKYIKRTWARGGVDWLYKGRLHREDGPAIIYDDGTKEWFLDGQQLSEEQLTVKMRKLKLEALGL